MGSANVGRPSLILYAVAALLLSVTGTMADDIYLEWIVSLNWTIRPVNIDQPVITINGMFPGPLLNATTNDNIHVNIFNHLDEPFLMTWSGVQQRLNSWQDGVSGTNCPIEAGKNWTYVFQLKDQIGSFIYFPSTRFQKAGGGFGPIRINNREVIPLPFDKPQDDFEVLIGDWYNISYKVSRQIAGQALENANFPQYILFNGKPAYNNLWGGRHESFNVTQGKTYRFRISNVGRELSLNFRIQNHQMMLVETEGSHTNKIALNSLDVHVGQSYSVLVTADQAIADYYMVATPTQVDTKLFPDTKGVAILHYANSTTPASGPLPSGPDPLDVHFSINQARSIRWNLTAGAARPNPQGTFNVSNANISQTFILHSTNGEIGNAPYYLVNNVSYLTPETPLKLADEYLNGTGVYLLDAFPVDSMAVEASRNTSVVSGIHRGWLELVLKNDLNVTDVWHLDGFGFFVVGLGIGEWSHNERSNYNLYDPVVRSSVQVYAKGWTAIYAYLDNPGMWNLHSQRLENWYLGEEIYVRVYDPDPNPAKERPPPDNLLYCGIITPPPPQSPSPSPPASTPPSRSPPASTPPSQSPSPSPPASTPPSRSPPASTPPSQSPSPSPPASTPPSPSPPANSGHGTPALIKSSLITSIILVILSKFVYELFCLL